MEIAIAGSGAAQQLEFAVALPGSSATDFHPVLDIGRACGAFTRPWGEAITPQGDMPKYRVLLIEKDASCLLPTPLMSKNWLV